ncbi:hypothetical protein Tco_0799874 [Tanacetum coccineum]|uniref:Uncharacterized protein n=1 Tax=Tanacetum coccineum TaxID=301880 RepID=A0ABQ4ZTU7_9ASTR
MSGKAAYYVCIALEVEQDSGGSPRCQKAIGGTTDQTRSERVPISSYDSPLLGGGHTPGSDEGRLKQDKLTDIVTALSQKVEGLESDLNKTKKLYATGFKKLINSGYNWILPQRKTHLETERVAAKDKVKDIFETTMKRVQSFVPIGLRWARDIIVEADSEMSENLLRKILYQANRPSQLRCLEDPQLTEGLIRNRYALSVDAFCTDIAKIIRERSKPDKHGHGNGKENTRARRMLSKSTIGQPLVNQSQHIK